MSTYNILICRNIGKIWLTEHANFLQEDNVNWLDHMNLQADLILHWMHMLEATFSKVVAYITWVKSLIWSCVSCRSTKCVELCLTNLLLNTACPDLANSVDPDQLASEEANWSRSALFIIKNVNFCQKLGSSNLIGCKLKVGVASNLFSKARVKWK